MRVDDLLDLKERTKSKDNGVYEKAQFELNVVFQKNLKRAIWRSHCGDILFFVPAIRTGSRRVNTRPCRPSGGRP